MLAITMAITAIMMLLITAVTTTKGILLRKNSPKIKNQPFVYGKLRAQNPAFPVPKPLDRLQVHQWPLPPQI
jgi:hypothetical protein